MESENSIKSRVLTILAEKGDMSISEIHERTGISFYKLKDVVPEMINEQKVELLGRKLHIKEVKDGKQ